MKQTISFGTYIAGAVIIAGVWLYATGALVFKGIVLEPALAALFMSLSTVVVAINAILLRKKVL